MGLWGRGATAVCLLGVGAIGIFRLGVVESSLGECQ